MYFDNDRATHERCGNVSSRKRRWGVVSSHRSAAVFKPIGREGINNASVMGSLSVDKSYTGVWYFR